jgi:ATP:corrinoid adenosyltransferase
VAAATFLAGGSRDEDPEVENDRYRRAREAVARRLPVVVPVPFAHGHKRLVAAGIAAAFLLGAGVGTGVRLRGDRTADGTKISPTTSGVTNTQSASGPMLQTEGVHLQAVVAELQKQVEQMQAENSTLRNTLSASDEHTTEVKSRLAAIEQQSSTQAQEVAQARNELNAARDELSQAKASLAKSEATSDALQFKLADREARLTEVSASLDREREMLSAGREIRDIMGARELHIVDVVDRDGKGRTKKAFGRAFYTQGKALIFYAFDLPAKNTTDGKLVYAAWGSNSNQVNAKGPHSLGIFYNDDQTQHRWAMKFDDPKVLEEIDTVFVTLEPTGRPFSVPTGKPILEAYFGTPPNHP